LYALPVSLVRATHPAHLILFDLIALIVFAKGTRYEAPHCEILFSFLFSPS
jgi:hypothetical protein